MLIILMLFLIIASILVLILKRNMETFYLLGMCLSLTTMLSGVLIYIAKKGGITQELQRFFYFTINLKTKIQYYEITLDHLGFIIALGRYLFPMFLLLMALHYSVVPWIRRNYWIKRIVIIIPVLTIIAYYPTIFMFLTEHQFQHIVTRITFNWIVLYILVSIILLVHEVYSISMKFFRRQFISITAFIITLSLLFILYFVQDPAQVYQFYSYDDVFGFSNYISSLVSIQAYITVVILNVFFAIVGFTSLMRYTKNIFESSREEITIKRKFDAISPGTSIFVHSIKNQLLANRVVFNRIRKQYQEETVDLVKLKEHTDLLSKQNETILLRIEELYRSIKTNTVHLIPISLEEIIENSLERFQSKYPHHTVDVNVTTHATVLADQMHLSEAIYNLLTNAQEAINETGKNEEGTISLSCYNVRLYTVFEIKDNGIGMDAEVMKKICEPFYSRKNSNSNWGMGLHYVREIAKEHFGSLRYESTPGVGSTFYILLPRYKE